MVPEMRLPLVLCSVQLHLIPDLSVYTILLLRHLEFHLHLSHTAEATASADSLP